MVSCMTAATRTKWLNLGQTLDNRCSTCGRQEAVLIKVYEATLATLTVQTMRKYSSRQNIRSLNIHVLGNWRNTSIDELSSVTIGQRMNLFVKQISFPN